MSKRDYDIRSKKYGEHVKAYTDQNLTDLMLKGIYNKATNIKKFIVLDLGCGTGLTSKALKQNVKEIYYLDISEEMIKKGINDGIINISSKIIIHDINNGQIPIQDSFFDIVISRFTVHDVKDKKFLFKDVHRILKDEGIFQIIDMYGIDSDTLDFYNLIHGWKTHHNSKQATFIELLDTYKDLFLNNGFKDLEISYYKSNVSTIDWLKENQISLERRELIESIIKSELSQNKNLSNFLKIKITRDEIKFKFPVVVISAINSKK